jgi:catechol 2,3-dioxygenase-like lactoylglutathione lyase family enzyme
MIHHPEFTPAPTTEIPGPDLFMTVIKVADWARALAWYVDTLGLMAVLSDSEHQFALLAAGTGRLALQGDPLRDPAQAAESVRLVFLVPDVDHERHRLIERGVEVGLPVENAQEGYREIRLHDPEGTAVTLFSWTDQTRGQRYASPPE